MVKKSVSFTPSQNRTNKSHFFEKYIQKIYLRHKNKILFEGGRGMNVPERLFCVFFLPVNFKFLFASELS